MASHIPDGCAAVIEVAQGMMVFGDREAGRAMLRDLLHQASVRHCADRPECARVLSVVAAMVGEDGCGEPVPLCATQAHDSVSSVCTAHKTLK